ncbi:MAG: sodium-translocating pyrophosphatase [Candidatus Bipolaricaulota bacterium]|nr:sodium-translocating pyrophosphatase [Candidatus Bipolaricaulota bacterium]
MTALIIIPALISVLALASAAVFNRSVVSKSRGTEKMRELQGHIRSGAFTFMLDEAKVMTITMVIIGVVLWVLFYWEIAVAFWIGSLLSMAAGFIGMNAATHSNGRTTHAARSSFKAALNVAFSGGSVMGLSVAGLALIGLVIVMVLFRHLFDPATLHIQTKPLFSLFGGEGAPINFIKGALLVSAYSMGASLVALFDRVGGGIYTKAADMAADMVGKVEMHLPEDDPRNPATIADNVGDNVGDVGGLGADLLESFVGAIISVIVMFLYIYVGRANESIQGIVRQLGLSAGLDAASYWWVLVAPLLIVAGGIFASFIAIFYIRFSRRQEGMQAVLMNGTRLAAVLTAITTFLFCWLSPLGLNILYEVILGLAAGVAIGFFSEYYTSTQFRPTRELARIYQSGPAVGVTEGMALGMASTLFPVLVIAGAVIGAYQLGSLLGIAFAAMGMLSFVAMTVSVDTYGPIADNAGGIATMAGLPPEVRDRTDALDSIGNTTAAIGKGFAIGSAAFAALALIAAFMWSAIGSAEQVIQPQLPIVGQIAASFSPSGNVIQIGAFVIAGLMLGAMVPYVFSSLLIRGVSRTAGLLVQEIRRQVKQNPKILSGEELADYKRCISITAHGGLRKMFLPALLAVLTPLIFGLIFGRYALGGFLIGALLSAIQLAIYCANSGGAMDNAKKYVEEGNYGGKNSEAHAAGVTADTVGDPLKDTVGPSLDILIKLMSVVSLVFASLFPLYPIFM